MNQFNFKLADRNCRLCRSSYDNNGRLALFINFEDDPCGFDDLVITVNLVDEDCPDGHAFIDSNNCPFAEGFLLDNGIGSPVGIGFSGLSSYPLYRIDLSKTEDVSNA